MNGQWSKRAKDLVFTVYDYKQREADRGGQRCCQMPAHAEYDSGHCNAITSQLSFSTPLFALYRPIHRILPWTWLKLNTNRLVSYHDDTMFSPGAVIQMQTINGPLSVQECRLVLFLPRFPCLSPSSRNRALRGRVLQFTQAIHKCVVLLAMNIRHSKVYRPFW